MAVTGVDALVSLGFQGVGQAQPDTADLDGDPATDRFLNLAWVDPLAAQWPASLPGSAPLPLFDLHLRADAASASLASPVRLSASSTAAGYTLSGPRLQLMVYAP